MGIILANFGKYAISDCPFILFVKQCIQCFPWSLNFCEIWIENKKFSFKKMFWKMLSVRCFVPGLHVNPCCADFILEKISQICKGWSSEIHRWNLSSWGTKACLSCSVNTMIADDLATPRARISAAMLLMFILWIILVSAHTELTGMSCSQACKCCEVISARHCTPVSSICLWGCTNGTLGYSPLEGHTEEDAMHYDEHIMIN